MSLYCPAFSLLLTQSLTMFCYIYSPPPQPSQTKLKADQDVEAVEAFASVVELN